jgi:hypothetical protein
VKGRQETYITHDGGEYTFKEAAKWCYDKGGHLPHLNDDEEYVFLTSVVIGEARAEDKKPIWLGDTEELRQEICLRVQRNHSVHGSLLQDDENKSPFFYEADKATVCECLFAPRVYSCCGITLEEGKKRHPSHKIHSPDCGAKRGLVCVLSSNHGKGSWMTAVSFPILSCGLLLLLINLWIFKRVVRSRGNDDRITGLLETTQNRPFDLDSRRGHTLISMTLDSFTPSAPLSIFGENNLNRDPPPPYDPNMGQHDYSYQKRGNL